MAALFRGNALINSKQPFIELAPSLEYKSTITGNYEMRLPWQETMIPLNEHAHYQQPLALKLFIRGREDDELVRHVERVCRHGLKRAFELAIIDLSLTAPTSARQIEAP